MDNKASLHSGLPQNFWQRWKHWLRIRPQNVGPRLETRTPTGLTTYSPPTDLDPAQRRWTSPRHIAPMVQIDERGGGCVSNGESSVAEKARQEMSSKRSSVSSSISDT